MKVVKNYDEEPKLKKQIKKSLNFKDDNTIYFALSLKVRKSLWEFVVVNFHGNVVLNRNSKDTIWNSLSAQKSIRDVLKKICNDLKTLFEDRNLPIVIEMIVNTKKKKTVI